VRTLSAGRIAPPANPETNGPHAIYAITHSSPEFQASHPAVTFETFRPFFDTRPAGILANIVICLIHQTNYLLDQQLRRLERDFVEQGGLRERMTRARLEALKNNGKNHHEFSSESSALSVVNRSAALTADSYSGFYH